MSAHLAFKRHCRKENFSAKAIRFSKSNSHCLRQGDTKMNTEYIKDYEYKELKHYILSYFLIVVASVGALRKGKR